MISARTQLLSEKNTPIGIVCGLSSRREVPRERAGPETDLGAIESSPENVLLVSHSPTPPPRPSVQSTRALLLFSSGMKMACASDTPWVKTALVSGVW